MWRVAAGKDAASACGDGAPGDACKLHHRCEVDLLTTGCSARAVKQGTSYTGDLQWVVFVGFCLVFLKVLKDKSCSFQRTQVSQSLAFGSRT